ncbi:MAG: PIN domain-containing protein [Alphaproteobacteria bacterium]|uniref:type II toxin-antitoxin system VapC family toxin n=1 Tax=Bradyrhizobium sp. TaxID=376 RepID=UPI001EB64E52|nr:PIN domain-containing protein [Bradyrhizobium sp.]MBV9570845.1 PIN domain-containing protein [Alphaproteobacteria bacterium]MBV9979095.1 PIN domain-containing protein [Bradyrhizobium sp.]
MILADTGLLVALFDPRDRDHAFCVERLRKIKEPLLTTLPVLTEAFHLLKPHSPGAHGLMRFVADEGLRVWFFDRAALDRAFALMQQYADAPMDLADASLVTAAETLAIRKVFTLDRKDFSTYRIRRGHRHLSFLLLEDP